jgi:DNA-binding NtrC family response regulator
MQAREPPVRILVVEDLAVVAQELAAMLEDMGCEVVGPYGRVDHALPATRSARLHGALLDVNLAEERVYPLVDVLRARGVPVAFTTGYGAAAIPDAYRDCPCLEKPFGTEDLARLVQRFRSDPGPPPAAV